MIDLSFANIAVIAFVALLILGPEKLPHAARTAGTLLRRMQRYIGNVKSEVARGMEIDELRKSHAEMEGMGKDLAKQVSDSVNAAPEETKSSVERRGHQDSSAETVLISQEVNNERRETKDRSFRQHRLAKTFAVPDWYKRQCGSRSRISPTVSSVIRRRSRVSGNLNLSL